MPASHLPEIDIIVVGTGNAAFSAALTASEHGMRVVMLERGSREWVGGNSWFTAGAYRMAHNGPEDLAGLVDIPTRPFTLPPYTQLDYEADMRRITRGRCDPRLTEILVREARDGADWMQRQGVRWRLMPERQAHESDGRLTFYGGLAVGTVGGGEGLIDAYVAAAANAGIEVWVSSAVDTLLSEDGHVAGVRIRTPSGGHNEVLCRSVVLASGGFEADSELRAEHLGPQWERARVRGTPHNTGEALVAALAIGAVPFGAWDGCHSIAWDAGAPSHGDRSVSNRYSRQAYPFGLMVNRHGERFLDEGADFRNYTYAKYGAAILEQPSGIAFQIFDAKVTALLSDVDYSTAGRSRFEASTMGDLAALAGIERRTFEETVRRFNAAVGPAPFNPSVLDGKSTVGIDPPKSNWAQSIDEPPFLAFAVACGITFTFGGLRINTDACVVDAGDNPISGLFAAGETVGGLFYHNYPGGTGLASGTVFGRRAGRSAASYVKHW